MPRYASVVDLHVIVRDQNGRVLLGKRRNTGWADGQFGLPSGHLENGESATAGAAREALEEVGIKPGELRLVHLMHHHTDSGRVAMFFQTATWSGDITNKEPDKCAGWSFVDPANPPGTIVPYVAEVLQHISDGIVYSERGWSAP